MLEGAWALISIAEQRGEQERTASTPLGPTWGVAAFWSGNLPEPEGGSPNWNVFWQRQRASAVGWLSCLQGQRKRGGDWDVDRESERNKAGCFILSHLLLLLILSWQWDPCGYMSFISTPLSISWILPWCDLQIHKMSWIVISPGKMGAAYLLLLKGRQTH